MKRYIDGSRDWRLTLSGREDAPCRKPAARSCPRQRRGRGDAASTGGGVFLDSSTLDHHRAHRGSLTRATEKGTGAEAPVPGVRCGRGSVAVVLGLVGALDR